MGILSRITLSLDRFANESRVAAGPIQIRGSGLKIGNYDIPEAELPHIRTELQEGKKDIGFWYHKFKWARLHETKPGSYELYLRDEKPAYERDAA